MGRLDWARLDVDYFTDDRVAALRALHGYKAEVFWTRFIAVTQRERAAIRCPEVAEFLGLANALGFPENDADEIGRIAASALGMGLCIRRSAAGHMVRWDARNRTRFEPPRSSTKEYETTKKRRQRAEKRVEEVPEMSPGQSRDVPGTFPTRNETLQNEDLDQDQERGAAPSSPPGLPHILTKYLERLADLDPMFKLADAARYIDIGEDFDLNPSDVGQVLARVEAWWRTAPKSKRWRSDPFRGFRNWLTNDQRRAAERAQQHGDDDDDEERRYQAHLAVLPGKLAEAIRADMADPNYGPGWPEVDDVEALVEHTLARFPDGPINSLVLDAFRIAKETA